MDWEELGFQIALKTNTSNFVPPAVIMDHLRESKNPVYAELMEATITHNINIFVLINNIRDKYRVYLMDKAKRGKCSFFQAQTEESARTFSQIY